MKTVSEKRNIAKAAGILGIATMLSRVFGMVRDIVVARIFGAGIFTDSFFAAFQIPNMLRRFFAEGALTSAFVPIFSETLTVKGIKASKELSDVSFTVLTILMSVITILGIIFSPFIVNLMFPGFSSIPGKFDLTVLLNRIMFPYIFFISLVALCMGILNSAKHFFTPAISTVFLNISMILAAIFLRGFFDAPIVALAIGVLIGGIIQLLIQLPVLWKHGYQIKPNFNFKLPEIKKISLLMLPATFGVGVYYLNITVSAILASMLPQGSVSYLYYAQRLFEFPQGIFTVSVAQAVLPSMSRQAAEGDIAGMKGSLSFALRLILFITIPATVGLITVSTPIMSIIFMGGEFSYSEALKSGNALLYYSLGLSSVAVSRVLAPAFYALKDTKTPVTIAFVAFIVNFAASIILMKSLLHSGLALATTISSVVNMSLLIWYLRKKTGSIGARKILITAIKSVISSIPMGIAAYYLVSFIDWSIAGGKLLKSIQLSAILLIAMIIYTISSYLLRSEESKDFYDIVRKKLKK